MLNGFAFVRPSWYCSPCSQGKGKEMAIYLKDGNAFAILGAAKTALREEGRSSEWDAFYKEATAGDYNHLLRTVFATFEEVVNGDKPKAPRKPKAKPAAK